MNCGNRKKIQKKFKLWGYTLKVEALNEVLSFLSHYQDVPSQDEALDVLLDNLQHQSLKSSILDKDSVHGVASLLLKAQTAGAVEEDSSNCISSAALRIIDDIFIIPKFRYDPVKKFFYEHTGRIPIHGDASAKAFLYRDRFLLLLQRLYRDPDFSRPAFSTERSQFGSREISPIQSLIGLTGRRWVMGVISQLEDGHFYLEDLTAAVEINLSNAISSKCVVKTEAYYFTVQDLFSDNDRVCLRKHNSLSRRRNALGWYLSEQDPPLANMASGNRYWSLGHHEHLHVLAFFVEAIGWVLVKTCGFPPLENRDKSISAFPGIDFFGCGTLTKEETLRFADMEKRAVNYMFVVISDIWLDNKDTMTRLEEVLHEYEKQDVVPSLFIFMGNFSSLPCNLSSNSFSSLRSQFGELGQIIGACTNLMQQSRFLLIPGPDDPGPSTALPRCALPKYITEEFKKHIPNALFSSNPCRVKFCNQEIVFFRQDLLYRMRRSCLIRPSTEETSDPFKHVACCYHNTSKPSLSTPSDCTACYLELRSLPSSLSHPTNGTAPLLLF
ncbi:hypothetical protein RHGRI_015705 [Rhododendron griersonianum]|uniref:DNA polymerase epsilon subunit n=1 Tax=Rhododendron griersonianum TaxID=479676 RepID=A0AAV6JN79_9ERIC|nr:hypothetical protein RHGRI_015705 [Rhododendron griersonianum]